MDIYLLIILFVIVLGIIYYRLYGNELFNNNIMPLEPMLPPEEKKNIINI